MGGGYCCTQSVHQLSGLLRNLATSIQSQSWLKIYIYSEKVGWGKNLGTKETLTLITILGLNFKILPKA